MPYLSDMADAVRHHHEYYDGGGYVDHLARETIPLGARIIAVADAYDAMTHPRPFRQPKDHQRAAAELRQNSGLQFDPQVVEHFLAALEEAGAAGVATAGMEAPPEEAGVGASPEEVALPQKRGARTRKGRRARRREERLRERREARERLEREALRALEEGPEEAPAAAVEEDAGTETGTGRESSGAPEDPPEDGPRTSPGGDRGGRTG